MLHKDTTDKTYKSFLEHVKTELEYDKDKIEVRIPESIEFSRDIR